MLVIFLCTLVRISCSEIILIYTSCCSSLGRLARFLDVIRRERGGRLIFVTLVCVAFILLSIHSSTTFRLRISTSSTIYSWISPLISKFSYVLLTSPASISPTFLL